MSLEKAVSPTRSNVDYMIVGQGLAGSILAMSLMEEGKSVLVIDNTAQESASKVAAGIINPITGHRFNLSEGFEEYFTEADLFYKKINSTSGKQIYQGVEQIRQIKNQGQFDYYKKRNDQAEYQDYLVNDTSSRQATDRALFTEQDFPAVAVANTAIVDCLALLEVVRSKLIHQGALLDEPFDHSDLQFSAQGVHYNNCTAKQIIFCEGASAVSNPWLKDLPFKLSKGHVVTVKLEQRTPALLNWGRWLTPSDRVGFAKLGSNYEWGEYSSQVSQIAVSELMKSLEQHTTIEATLVKAKAGIRPTTLHRQPFIGPIKKNPQAYCFNGFGSKGCLLIPFYAKRLIEHLLLGRELPAEVTRCL